MLQRHRYRRLLSNLQRSGTPVSRHHQPRLSLGNLRGVRINISDSRPDLAPYRLRHLKQIMNEVEMLQDGRGKSTIKEMCGTEILTFS